MRLIEQADRDQEQAYLGEMPVVRAEMKAGANGEQSKAEREED